MKKNIFFNLQQLSTGSLVGFILISTLFFSCNSGSNKKNKTDYEKTEKKRDTISEVKKVKEKPPLVIRYSLDSIQNASQLDSLRENYSKEQLDIIYALNRIDISRIQAGSAMIIPDTLLQDLMEYSPFPKHLTFLDTIPKTVIIAQRIQAFGLYEQGKLLKWGPVSAGKQSTPTPNGLHYGNYKSENKVSSVNDAWHLPYYFNFMNSFGVGVHQYVLPGYPASHACVRLRLDDAKYIYYWANQWQLGEKGKYLKKNGTPFMVFGKYDYDKPAPWKQLVADSKSNELTQEEMDTLKKFVEKYKKDSMNFPDTEKDSDSSKETSNFNT